MSFGTPGQISVGAYIVGNEEVIAYEFNTEAKDFAVWKNYKA